MKRLTKIGAIILTLILSLSMVACSNSYPKIKSAFEKANYTQSETAEALAKDFKTFTDSEGKEQALTFHVLVKNVANYAVILEFKATDDMIQYYKDNKSARDLIKDITENEDAKAFYNELKEHGYANGNCLLIPVGIDYKEMLDIMKNA